MKGPWEEPGHPISGDLVFLKSRNRRSYDDYGIMLITGRGERGELKGVITNYKGKTSYVESCVLDCIDIHGNVWELHESHFKFRFIIKKNFPKEYLQSINNTGKL